MLQFAYLTDVLHATDTFCNNLRHSEVITAFIFDTLTAFIY